MSSRQYSRRRSPFFGTTIHGGAFLLIPEAVRLHKAAVVCLGRKLGETKASRLALSLYFKAILGIQRVFHFETLDDPGLAILTGGKRVLGRNMLGGLIRAAPVRGVMNLVRKTAPRLPEASAQLFSIDEHVVPRFTKKFNIRKGFHTIRNKHMKVEKLFFAYDLIGRKLLPVIVTKGHEKLAVVTKSMISSIRRRARGAKTTIILDAGAAQNHDDLLDVAVHDNQVTLVRAPRRPPYRKKWAKIPKEHWQRLEEPGTHKKAPPKIIHIAETTMDVRGPKRRSCHSVRTLVVREKSRKGKDRWHAIWVFGDEETAAYDLVQTFRQRQHHEQCYRVLLHDAYIDTVPSGYDKNSTNPKRPGFKKNALALYAWVTALATNSLVDFCGQLGTQLCHAHPRTLRRWLLNVRADIFLGDGTLIVLLRPKRLHKLWQKLVDRANRRATRIPWMDNRRLILSLEPPSGSANTRQISSGPVLPQDERGVEF